MAKQILYENAREQVFPREDGSFPKRPASLAVDSLKLEAESLQSKKFPDWRARSSALTKRFRSPRRQKITPFCATHITHRPGTTWNDWKWNKP